MILLFMFMQIQVLALFVVAVVLAGNLNRTVAPIRQNNSTRMDGTHSDRRELIELQSIQHSCNSIFLGMVTIFLLTSIVGLVATGICYFVVGLDLEPIEVAENRVGIEKTIDLAMVSFLNYWQWPLVICHGLLSFFVFPPYVTYLYRKALERYRTRANARFQQYYQQEWWNQTRAHISVEPPSKVGTKDSSAINAM